MNLTAITRSPAKEKNLNRARRTKKVPAVLYGPRIKSTALFIDVEEFRTIFSQTGENTLIDLLVKENGQNKKYRVFVREIQEDPLSHNLLHVDFYQPRMDEMTELEVPFVFVGEAPAVKNEGGMLIKILRGIVVRGLPKDIPHNIKIDLTVLEHINDKIIAGDLKLNKELAILADASDVIVHIEAPRTKEEEFDEAEAEGVDSEAADEQKDEAEQEAEAQTKQSDQSSGSQK